MEESSPSPPAAASSPPSKGKKISESGWGSMTDDIWHDILKRLPARSLASAACVCKSWNQIANRILSHPKLAPAVYGSDYDTWLTARREGHGEILDCEMILNHIYDEECNENMMSIMKLGNRIDCPDLYIGNTKRRKYSIGSEKSRLITSLDFHAVTGGNEEYLFVDGFGIKTGDYFQFYHSDPSVASSSCNDVSGSLRNLKLDWSSGNRFHSNVLDNNVGRKEVFGGFIFSCCSRGESFFGRHNVDGAPFLENFPGVPLSGIFCSGEIGRGFSILNEHESQYEGTISCCLHVYSSVYLLMSCSPATLDC